MIKIRYLQGILQMYIYVKILYIGIYIYKVSLVIHNWTVSKVIILKNYRDLGDLQEKNQYFLLFVAYLVYRKKGKTI